MQVIARQNIWHNGAVLTAGRAYDVSPDDAARLARSGLADIPQAQETEKIKSQEKIVPAAKKAAKKAKK
jgi:hypothetical protein